MIYNVTFNPETHTYHNEDLNFDYPISASKIAGQIAGHDMDKVNPKLLAKASEEGTEEHKSLEICIVTDGAIQDSDISKWFYENYFEDYEDWQAEKIIYTSGLPLDYAGKLDAIARRKSDGKFVIFDLKTGRKDTKYWNAQLSLYRMALCQMYEISGKDIELVVLHCNKGTYKEVPLTGMNDAELIAFLQSMASETTYIQPKYETAEAIMAELETELNAQAILEKKMKEAEERLEHWKATLLQVMKDNQILSLETENFKFTPVAESQSISLDSTTIKKDQALWDSLPKKTTTRKGYLKVTEKKS